MRRTCLLLTLYGFLLASAVSAGLKNSRPKFKIATTSTTEPPSLDDESEIDGNKTEGLDGNSTASHNLTGIPQIDYIWDPNLPRELNGYNLSDYPFYETIPKDIDFKCDGLHDGFYASVPHKCQVYHHCLYGTRYDFLCANFTAFDQKTFICHFVSEIDCANSKKYWHRNDALYQAASTTTIAPPPTTTTTTTTTTTAAPIQPPEFADSPRSGGRRRRPFRRRPAYDYYDQEYYDDDYERPRTRGSGYDRRDDYDYDDRQQYNARNRDRERDREHFRDHPRDRDRDYRDRDPVSRPREHSTERPVAVRDEEDSLVMRPRDRFPPRNNRRDPPRVDEADNERRHQDQRYDRGFAKDDYDEEPASETLVKPAAPSTSVYARPRAPPKIRRPVPLSEQDRFAYKASSVQPIVGEHKRTTTSTTESSVARDQDYYEDELEERPARRPVRRRPYRERDRHLIDAPRDVRDRERDRERDRPLRPSRYRDEEDDMRPRKFPERPRDRDRYYERARDRALLDREKESSVIMDRERDHRPGLRRPALRDKENDRLPSQQSGKDSAEEPQSKDTNPITQDYEDGQGSKDRDPVTRPTVDDKADDKKEEPEVRKLEDDYPPDDEYYDDEYSFSSSTSSSSSAPASTALPPRMTVRIVKRPFLPSRGGNPNPRGLSPVGIKAPDSGNKDPKPLTPSISIKSLPSSTGNPKRPIKVEDRYQDRSYDAYRIIDTDGSRTDSLAQDLGPKSHDGFDPNWKAQDEKSEIKWAPEERRPSPSRGNRPNNTQSNNNFGEQNRKDVTGPSSVAKQRVNEVPHHLVDIPESEYDVALNEALTPSLNQDSLPSGFVLPLQRQGNREPALQPSENNYRVRPFKPDASHQLQVQHHQYHPQQQQQQKSFAPSPGFFPLTRINDERATTSTQYYKTPEVVHVGAYNRQADRNPWHDYTGY